MGFNNAAKGSLCIHSHTVSLVQNHELKLWDLATVRMSGDLPLRKLLDFLTHDLNASFVGCVQLKNSLTVKVSPEKFFGQS